MYARLLIPLDGSKTAEAVLPYGRTLAEKPPGILKSMLSIKSSPVRILCHPVERYYVNDRPSSENRTNVGESGRAIVGDDYARE